MEGPPGLAAFGGPLALYCELASRADRQVCAPHCMQGGCPGAMDSSRAFRSNLFESNAALTPFMPLMAAPLSEEEPQLHMDTVKTADAPQVR
jgi:hypothetical protein